MLVDVTAGDLPDTTVPCRGQLIEAIVAAEHERRRSSGAEDTRDQRYTFELCYSNRVRFRTRRVAQRPEHIEHRRNTELTSRAASVLEPGVERRGPREGDSGPLKNFGYVLGRQRELQAQCAEDVAGPRRRTRSTVAVLDHRDAGSADD